MNERRNKIEVEESRNQINEFKLKHSMMKIDRNEKAKSKIKEKNLSENNETQTEKKVKRI